MVLVVLKRRSVDVRYPRLSFLSHVTEVDDRFLTRRAGVK